MRRHWQGDPSDDARSPARGGVNHQFSVEHADTLSHADDSQPRMSARVQLEPDAGVGNLQTDIAAFIRQLHRCLGGVTMPRDVVKRFLREAVHAQRHRRIDDQGQFAVGGRKRDVDVSLV